ncbi:MAG: TrmH family RNA methyltransferase, partial [Chitinophagales bacterium]
MAKKKDIFFGRHPALETLKSDQSVDKIFIQKGATGQEIGEIRAFCKEHNIPTKTVPKEKIDYMLYPIYHGKEVNHQGVMGFYGAIKYHNLDDILHQTLSKGEDALFVLLDNVTDVRNVGAIARTAECLGAHAIVIPSKGAAQINAEAIKASAGAINNIPICREKNMPSTIDYLKMNGIAIIGSSLNTEKPIYSINFNKPTAIILGSEGEGMTF